MARFQVDVRDIRRAANEAALAEIQTGARQVYNQARIFTPVDTGRLRASIHLTVSRAFNNPSARIYTNVNYAPFVHDGTQPHVIRPRRRGGRLRFRVGGMTVFAREVHHPGTSPTTFLTRALRRVAEERGWRYREDGIS